MRFSQSLVFFGCVAVLLTLGRPVRAAMRSIFVPGKTMAVILMQGISGIQPTDPDPRSLYDALAIPAQSPPGGGGGEGKVIALSDKAFSLTCAHRGGDRFNVNCTIVVKPSSRSSVSIAQQTAEVTVTGAEAQKLYTQFAGSGSTRVFVWQSTNGLMHFSASPEEFRFKFAQ